MIRLVFTKKRALLFLALSTVLSAAPIDTVNTSIAQNVLDDSFTNTYKKALVRYTNKDYKESYDMFYKLFNLKPNDTLVNYYLGRSAFELKMYDDALLAYERVLFEEPKNNKVKLEIGRTFFELKNYKDAKRSFLEVKKDPKLPKDIENVINVYLAMIDQNTTTHRVSGVLMFGLSYDSNINSRSKYDTFDNVYIPGFNLYANMSNTTQDQSALYNQEVGVVSYVYKLDDTMDTKHDVLLFNKDSFVSKYNTTDVELIGYTPSIQKRYSKDIVVDYALYMDSMWYGGDKYLQTIGINPKVDYIYDQTNKISGYFKYQDKAFQKSSDKGKNSRYYELSSTWSHIYDPKLLFNTAVTLEHEEKKSGTRSDIDYSGIKGSFSATYTLNEKIILTPNIAYNISKYKDQDINYLKKIKDKELRAGLSGVYIYAPQWIAQGIVGYTRQDSNIKPNEYDKYNLGINIIRQF